MRKFVLVCLSLMIVISLAIVASAWYSYNSGKSLEATDDIVNGMAEHHGATATDYMPHVPENLEPIGFTLAGIVAGFITGYLWEDISELSSKGNKTSPSRR